MANQRLNQRTSCVAQCLRVDKVIKTRTWKVARIANAMFIRKFKKAISCFQIEVFFPVIFLCVSSIFYSHFSLSLEQQSGIEHISNRSNINNNITMTSWRNQGMTPYWISRKNYSNYLNYLNHLELSKSHSFHL